MQIQQLNSSHVEVYQSIRLQALRDSPTAFNSSYEEEKKRPLSAFAKSLSVTPSRTVFGAFDGSKIVAIVGVGRESRKKVNHKGSINSMFVAPSYRRQGLGKQLLTHALRFADSLAGLIQLTLVVNISNISAISLYKSFGFNSFGIEPNAVFIDGVFHDEMHMVRLVNLMNNPTRCCKGF